MSLPRPQRRAGPGAGASGRSSGPLAELLGASRFRLGPHTTRVAANLTAHGGTVDDRAPAWIGADLPPHHAPSVSLGEARGTLGPYSFGFLDNRSGVAPLAAPLPRRPRVGPIALVCGRREALVDVGPLVVARDLGVSWIISVGDGDPADVLRFLAADGATRAVLLAPGDGAAPDAIRAAANKPVAVLGGDPLLRAAVRRAGGLATDDLEAWLAFGALVEVMAPVEGGATPQRPVAVVAGGGAAQIAAMARAAALDLPIITVDDDDPDEVERAVAKAIAGADLVLRIGLGAPSGDAATTGPPSLILDPTAPERTRALLAALGARLAPPPAPIPRVRADRARAQAILDESAVLDDHPTKRVLHTYGAKVTRQAPASSPTAALRIAQQLGYPLDVVASDEIRFAANAADLKRAAGVLLDRASFVLIRESLPSTPRSTLTVRQEGALGLVARAGKERALLPLDRSDAIHLARTLSGDVARPLVDLLARATTAAVELHLELDLEIYCGEDPTIVTASARRGHSPSGN